MDRKWVSKCFTLLEVEFKFNYLNPESTYGILLILERLKAKIKACEKGL
jgi:hypothetical protein